MGSKFASLLIRTNNINDVVSVVKATHQDSPCKNLTKNYNRLAGFFNLNSNSDLIESFDKILANHNKDEYFIIDFQNNWVGVFCENFSWESIKDRGLKVSKRISYPILSIGYFDDDVFEMNVFQYGKVMTSHMIGENLSFYGLRKKTGDINKMINVLQLDINKIEIEEILKCNDLYEMVSELEKKFSILFALNCYNVEDIKQSVKYPFVVERI